MQLWENYTAGKLSGMLCRAHDRLICLLCSSPPEIRAAVVCALGTFVSAPPAQPHCSLSSSSLSSSTLSLSAGSPSNSLNLSAAAAPDAQLIAEDHTTLKLILGAVDDPSPLVRTVPSPFLFSLYFLLLPCLLFSPQQYIE